jgi:hypothetical protein
MPSSRRPPTAPRPAAAVVATAALAAVLTAAGCGEPTSPAGTSAETGATASATSLRRTGGVAGFDDRLSVAADGVVSGTTRTAAVDCTVSAQTVRTLASAPPPSIAPAAGTDRMEVTLRREDGTVDLGEAQGADPLSTTARGLLDDVQRPQDQRTVCR